MRKINYFEIISDIPFGDEIDFLESEMKSAAHDYFCKPQTFIKGLRQAINDYKRKRIEISEKRRFEIETDLKKDIEELEKDWDKEFCMFEYWKAEKRKKNSLRLTINGTLILMIQLLMMITLNSVLVIIKIRFVRNWIS
jgi:hypothetical protein